MKSLLNFVYHSFQALFRTHHGGGVLVVPGLPVEHHGGPRVRPLETLLAAPVEDRAHRGGDDAEHGEHAEHRRRHVAARAVLLGPRHRVRNGATVSALRCCGGGSHIITSGCGCGCSCSWY